MVKEQPKPKPMTSNEEIVTKENANLTEAEVKTLEEIEKMLLENLELEELSEDKIIMEYKKITDAIGSNGEIILRLRKTLEEWISFRLKEHRVHQKMKQEIEEDEAIEKLRFVFDGIETSYIHMEKVQVYTRPGIDYDLDSILQKIEIKGFDAKTNYGLMNHSDDCDYYPHNKPQYQDGYVPDK